MPTLTDLFNIRIGVGARSVFIEIMGAEVAVMKSPDRPPLRPEAPPVRYSDVSFEEILGSENVTRESVYCIIPPSHYYRNTLVFPFSERQKIESTIKFEVQDTLPFAEEEFLTDFMVFSSDREKGGHSENEVLAFTVKKDVVKDLIDSFGVYRENLKSLIPYDAALLHSSLSVVDAPSFLCADIQNDATCLQHVRAGRIAHSAFISRRSDDLYRNALSSLVLMLIKSGGEVPLFVNTRSVASEEFRRLNEETFGELGVTCRVFPAYMLGGDVPEVGPAPDMIVLAGGLHHANLPPSKKVNFLKEEFRARPKGYLRIKDFVTFGVLLIVLLALSLSNLFTDLSSTRSQNRELRRTLSELSAKVFGKPSIKAGEAQRELESLKSTISRIETSIDRKSSGVELLRELSSFLPNDVVLEFTDIIIERERIKFAGKARTFADIDRIREALGLSDFFSEVTVANTGTTGSTEGFAVSFLFDIKVKSAASGPAKGGPQ